MNFKGNREKAAKGLTGDELWGTRKIEYARNVIKGGSQGAMFLPCSSHVPRCSAFQFVFHKRGPTFLSSPSFNDVNPVKCAVVDIAIGGK